MGLIRSARTAPDQSDRPIAFRSWFDEQPTSFRPESVAAREDRLADRAESVLLSGPHRAAVVPSRTTPILRGRSLAHDRRGNLVRPDFLVFAARLFGRPCASGRCWQDLNRSHPRGSKPSWSRASCAGDRARRPGRHSPGDLRTPLCVGLLRPVILWPTPENCPMSPCERLASLTHELAHLHHGDDWVALLAEIWRSLTWFYPPVHLAVACLRREREYRCDDMAAATLDTPEHYAQWLLDLAPVRVSPPPPSWPRHSSGATSLADRIRRILRGESKWRSRSAGGAGRCWPCSAFLILGTAGSVRLIGFAGRAVADEPADAPLPTAHSPRTRRQAPRGDEAL